MIIQSPLHSSYEFNITLNCSYRGSHCSTFERDGHKILKVTHMTYDFSNRDSSASQRMESDTRPTPELLEFTAYVETTTHPTLPPHHPSDDYH